MLQYFEMQDGTSSKFWQISLTANTIATRYGKIGTHGKTTTKDFDDPAKARQEYDKLVKEKTGKGYIEIVKDSKALTPGDFYIISEKEAVARFQLNQYINGLYDDGGKYMVYDGDVTFDSMLDTYKFCVAAKDDIYGIIVDGNLTVNGVLFQPDIDNGEHLLVTGNVQVKSINKGGGEFYIKGDLLAEQTIYGYYNHGELTVEGRTQALAIFADDHSFTFKGGVSGTIVGDHEIEGVDGGYSDITVLRPELIREKEYADSDKVGKYINKGQHILRDEFLPGFKASANVPKKAVASVQPEILTAEEAKAKFDFSGYDPIGVIDFNLVLYFEKGLTIDGDLTADLARQMLEDQEEPAEIADLLVFVNGNLTVKGDISLGEESFPCLFVRGNVKCDVLYSGSEFIHITGNADIKFALDGNYNDGAITIEGITSVPYVLNSDHDTNITPKGAVLINYFGDSDDFFTYDYTENDFEKVMAAGTFKNKEFDRHAFIDMLKAKKSPLKKGVQVGRLVVMEELERLKATPDTIQVLDLSNKSLSKFPGILTTFSALKKLTLSGNSIKEIPAGIAALEQLEELHLSGGALETLPLELAQLKQLRVLDLSKNKDLKIPEGFSQSDSLRVLDVSKCIGFGLTAGIPALEELRCDKCTDVSPVDFPAAILGCTGLKRLSMNQNSIRQIPAALTTLTQLEELYLDSALSYINELPDLSGLTKLRIIHASGIYNDASSPLVKQELLKGFFKITSLEELKIDLYRRWLQDLDKDDFEDIAKNLVHDPVRLQEIKDLQASKTDFGDGRMVGHLRKPLTAAHLEGIGALQQLRILNLNDNMLSELPEELYGLPKLRSLSLKGNSFTIDDRLTIAERLPDVDLDLRENWVPNEVIDTPAAKLWKEVADLIEAGNDLWFNYAGEPLNAIKKYNEALEYFNTGKVKDKYLFLYLHYVKTNAYSNLASDDYYDDMSEEDKKKGRLTCIETGLKGLSLIPADMLPDTSMGEFYKEAIRIMGNAVAWEMHETYEDVAKMEEALVLINQAAAWVKNKSEYFIYDTKIRILLRLGRKEEAWQLVKKTLEENKSYTDLKDIEDSKEYKQWLKKQ